MFETLLQKQEQKSLKSTKNLYKLTKILFKNLLKQ
jgi:hypothetical protein